MAPRNHQIFQLPTGCQTGKPFDYPAGNINLSACIFCSQWGQQPQLAAAGLSEDEAGQLRIAMGDVISPGGTAPLMAEVLDGGKTGTAEIVVDGQQSNVLWLVGFNERYAICMMHYDATTTPIHDIARAILA